MNKTSIVTDIQRELSRLYQSEQADVTELRVPEDIHDKINAECGDVNVTHVLNPTTGRAVKLVTDATLEPDEIVYQHG